MKNSLFHESSISVDKFMNMHHVHLDKNIDDMTDKEVVSDFNNMPIEERESAVAPFYQSVEALWENVYSLESPSFEELELNILDAKKEVLNCSRKLRN